MERGILCGAVALCLTPCARLAIIAPAMPTLSQFRLNRTPLRRIPFWAQALALCALFAIVSVAIVDDYGVSGHEIDQHRIAIANADYIATGDISALSQPVDIAFRYYGVAFGMPLLLAERALRLQDGRHIYLTRHLMMHLFFIAGGFVCGMLAYRMSGSRWIALLAMLMFLLHPRLYAHSFFNNKDIPFAALFVIALYFSHRAFRRDTIYAFLLCGIGVGLAINVRPFGLMLLPLILAMRAPDLWQASGRGERKRILATAGVFAAAALATVYISHPYYWENPLRFIEGVRALSRHPVIPYNLFMGEIYRSDAVPWNFIPVWFAITAPPATLLLGAFGAAAVCWQGAARPLAALRDREIRFRVLLLGCVALPAAVVIALHLRVYNGWRLMYFMWGPFCLLAVVGLHTITNIRMRGGIWKVMARLPGWVCGNGLRRELVYGVVGVGLITTLTAMAALHPHQQAYFNALVDTKTPGALEKRYDLDYWIMARLQSLEYLLARYPDDTLRVFPRIGMARRWLPQEDRARIIDSNNPHAADFHLLRGYMQDRFFTKNIRETGLYSHPRIERRSMPERQPIHSVRAYGSAIGIVLAKDAAAYHAAYEDVAANGTPLAHSDFDIYAYDGALYYLSDNCEPPMSRDAAIWLFLHIIPAAPADLPADSHEHGFENRDFRLDAHAAFFDGKCMGMQPLPDYAIARIRTGQNAAASGGAQWRVDVNLSARAASQALYESVTAGDYGLPAAQSDFDVYLRGKGLAYLKENCDAGDADARFFLHIIPVDPADLQADGREHGFANLDFQFADHGAYAGDICVAALDLPDYAIERIRTGQFVSGEGRLWSAEFPVGR